VVGQTIIITVWLGGRSYQPCTLILYRNRHTLGIFYLQSLVLCSPNLPTTEFFSICIAIYCARDVRSTSQHVMTSLTERSFFGALLWKTVCIYINTTCVEPLLTQITRDHELVVFFRQPTMAIDLHFVVYW
jgi:hypothetical protein